MSGGPSRNTVLFAKTEASYGVDSVPTESANAIKVRSVSWAQEGLRMVDRPSVRGSLGMEQRIYGGELRKISIEVELKGSGTAGTAPEIAPLLRACALAETVVGATSVTYKPTSSTQESITIYLFEFGRKRHIMTGCRGTVSFEFNAGEVAVAKFEFVGHWTQPTDVTRPTPTYSAVVPKTAIAMSISIASVTTLVVRKFMFDTKSNVETGADIKATDGYGPTNITGRDVTGQVTFESELDSVIDVDSLMVAGTRFAFDSGVLGSTAGNRVRLTTPASSTYFMSTSPEQDAGIDMRTMDFGVDDSTPDQEISLIFT